MRQLAKKLILKSKLLTLFANSYRRRLVSRKFGVNFGRKAFIGYSTIFEGRNNLRQQQFCYLIFCRVRFLYWGWQQILQDADRQVLFYWPQCGMHFWEASGPYLCLYASRLFFHKPFHRLFVCGRTAISGTSGAVR